jgi:sugar phosphate isomerase/epimerase
LNANQSSIAIRLGIRAHDLGRFSADDLARRVAAEGLDCVQLALGKAIEGVDLRHGVINAGLASGIGDAFGRHKVRIEVLGCYINPIHPDPETRISLIGLFKEHLRHAREFGCDIVALESGSLNGDYSPHPGNTSEAAFQNLLVSMREMVLEAEDCGVMVGIEAVTSHVISTPEKMRRLLDEIPSPHLQVVFDPVNLLSLANCLSQREIMRRSFDLFGDRIAVVHAKDFRVGDGCLAVCPAGVGMLDYELLLSWLARHKTGIAILLEEAGPDHVASCVRFIRNQLPIPIS